MNATQPQPAPDDPQALPYVEPPTAGFIVQLFVVPAIIVLVIVMVWLLFNWLAQMGSSPREYLAQISKNNANSWIAAHNLAQELQTNAGLRRDAQVARELGQMLSRSLAAAATDDDSVKLRIFLCRALGEFQVPDALPVLVQAAGGGTSEAELNVRGTALQALALLIGNLQQAQSDAWHDPEVERVLLASAAANDPRLQEPAVYALGLIGTPRALEVLRNSLDESYPANVRYNAATALARHADPAAIPQLIAMLDPNTAEGVEQETGPQAQDFKRAMILSNGLAACEVFARASPEPLDPQLIEAIDQLAAADLQQHFSQRALALEIRNRALQTQAAVAQSKQNSSGTSPPPGSTPAAQPADAR